MRTLLIRQRPSRTHACVAWCALAGIALAHSVSAQERPIARRPSDGGTTFSLGQPGSWETSVGAALGRRATEGSIGAIAEARIGVYRELLFPSLGLGGIQLEAYGGSLNTQYNGGVRFRLVSPFLRIGVGADYNVADRTLRPHLSALWPVRRGGVFHDGTLLRFDAVPGPVRTLTLGVEVPLFRRIPWGATRPVRDRVQLEDRRPAPIDAPRPTPALASTLDVVRDAARRVQRLCVPWLNTKGSGGAASEAAVLRRLEALRAEVNASGTPRSLDDEARRLHDAVDRAFSLAISPEVPADQTTAVGRRAGNAAREILLDEVLIPYDRLIGQRKEKDTTHGFAVLARGAFLRWLHVESGIPASVHAAAMAVFYVMLETVESNRREAHDEWGDSRNVWLPLQLALRPEQHDTQRELDALIARAIGEPFSDGNIVSYVINEQFQYQVSRTIRAARDYHVLWIHDFRGTDASGDPDEMSFRHVLRSYFAAMTARVRAYDSTGVFPTYMIILDQWFYEATHSRMWMSLLEDPLRHHVSLPRAYAAWGDSIAAAQDTLRAAIEASSLLMAQRNQYGDAWLRNLIKVHVNITNASDPTFWSWHAATGFPQPDTWMRDHRKLVFYDIAEEDPYRGEALFTGAGIGEHYANLSWEDRSLLLRGPAALSLKAAARDLFMGQGIRGDRLPAMLRVRPLASDYEDQIARHAFSAQRPLRALVVQNGTGYADKQVDLVKSLLYTLMPPGSVIKIPDSLWNGTLWGSALVGCALRGVRVLIIAPALSNAPARAFGSMARSRELLWRMLMASKLLAPEIAAHGGLLKVGLYSSTIPVTDIPGKVRAVKTTLEQHAWLRELFDFPVAVYPGLDALATTFGALSAANPGVRDFESKERPLLHLKANYFASRDAWRVMSRTEWVDVTRQFVELRLAQVRARAAAVGSFAQVPDTVLQMGDAVVEQWYQGLSREARERVVFFTLLGSSNQNERSMVSDGEDGIVLSNWPSVIPYLDLLSLVGQSRWIDDPKELDELLPRQNALLTRIAHWFTLQF